MKPHFLARSMHVLVLIFLALTGISFLLMPLFVQDYFKTAGIVPSQPAWILMLFLYATAVPFFMLLLNVKRLCKNLLENKPFTLSSIKALNWIGLCAFSDFVLYAFGTISILKNLLSLTLMVAAFMIGLVSLLLSQLVKDAKEIKEEHDYTI
ncbi:DUF2975 domain-containing protein [Heyndrickxia acidicola]|uniref:DUF2975 domain-containing protein n=1 Tax=Heyndrickxia acidicola TaxID=209389 RepID=A0ABU6MMH0_9BACI|nr:DUF2975 domain-containing protein [Heyndrickxia acidicola]MED1204407.1 DUF2975 domain-containing protein [Heyndrickxia acidicola]